MFSIYNDSDRDSYTERDRESREYLLYNADLEDYMSLLQDQVRDPFDSGVGINFVKKIRKLVPDNDRMDDYCAKILDSITDMYSNMEIDLDGINSHYLDTTMSIYKFFIKNVRKLTGVFLKEYIFNPANRKALVQDYQDAKMGNYPKEQFGNKENYILVTFLKKIVKSIAKDDDLNLSTFIKFVKRSDDCPDYVFDVEEMLDRGIIEDYGIYEELMSFFWDSNIRDSMINKLNLKINDAIVQPVLKEMGYDTFPLTLIAQDDDDDLQDEDAEENPNVIENPDEPESEYDEKQVNS